MENIGKGKCGRRYAEDDWFELACIMALFTPKKAAVGENGNACCTWVEMDTLGGNSRWRYRSIATCSLSMTARGYGSYETAGYEQGIDCDTRMVS